jgi:large conductance mechanosensitive channel
MQGFKNFVMRGNLIELAVAFVIGLAFAAVVKAFTDMLVALLGRLGGTPNFDSYRPGGVPVGAFLTALVAFFITAAVVYFFIVKPYELAKSRLMGPEPTPEPEEEVVLLREIRDALRGRA